MILILVGLALWVAIHLLGGTALCSSLANILGAISVIHYIYAIN